MRLRPVIIACTIVLIAAACSSGGSDAPAETNVTGVPASGGTIRVAMTSDFQAALDPAKQYEAVSSELYRCCLLRTLLAFEGVPGDEGGSELRPDLATELPAVSEDGLTWTFTIREGAAYAPPFEAGSVTAEDFVRALEREADPRANVGGYSFYFSVIEGFDEFTAGKAKTISGISAPSPQTLEVRLSEPTGDLGYRFALPATAPIPPLGDAPMGVAAGHTADYGRFLIEPGRT
ncbi:MAG: ABC transporter substrate-binding protein [Actinomycetota bacterium]